MLAGLNPVYIILAVVLAAATVGVASILSEKNRTLFAYSVLVLMLGVYVGFAVIAVDAAQFMTRPVITVLMVEALTALVLMFIGLGAVNSDKPWILGVLILIHGGVDLAHLLMGTPHSPAWYELLCVIYDGIVGVAFVWMLSPKEATAPVPEAEPEEINSVLSSVRKHKGSET